MDLGEYIKHRRQELRLSQETLGKMCGYSQGYIWQLETGYNPKTGKSITPSVDALEAISRALQVPLDRLTLIALGRDPDKASSVPITESLEAFASVWDRLTPDEQAEIRRYAGYLEASRKEQRGQ